MTMTRRTFLKRGLAGATAVALLSASCSIDVSFSGQAQIGKVVRGSAPLPEPFGAPLPIPPVLAPVSSAGNADLYEITQRAAEVEILPGPRTTIWGYNGIFPGPTIVARRGRQVTVRMRNELPVPTVTHLHGGVTPPGSDGYPTDLLLPAGGPEPHSHHGIPFGTVVEGEREYVYPVEQRATTLWYHDHRMDFTGPQVFRGLAGFFIIHDEEEDALPLPKGDKDIPLMIADRSFGADGALLYPALDPTLLGEPGVGRDFMEGVLGDVILVNGAPWPFLEVAATRYRFRLLNASNARRYVLELDPPPPDGDAFVQVGSDGGLLAAPVTHDRLSISPAERFDVIIDFGRYPVGTSVTLKSRVGDDDLNVMQFRVARSERDDSAIPERLSEIEPLDPDSAVETRRFRFNRGDVHGERGWVVDGEQFHPDHIAASPQLGATEIWELRGNTHHPIHLHLVHFQVLSRNGGDPAPEDAGWKDTVNLNNGEEVRVIARFDGYRGKYVFQCHNLEHEDMMMMANFEVV